MKTSLLALSGTVALAIVGAALAADLPIQPPPAPAPVFTWTGVYLGGHIGYGWASDNALLSVDPPIGPTSIGASTVPFETKPQGVLGGVHIGYNYQAGSFVVGLEGDVDGTDTSKTAKPLDFVTSTTNSYVQGSIRGRVGLAFERVLVYATGGGAYAGIRNTYNVLGSGNSFSTTRSGWVVGGGLEYALDEHWSARAEYRYADFGNFSDRPIVFPGISERHHWTEHQVRVGFSYKFGPRAETPAVSKF
jgi:outer membrane immunogenic protein